MLMVDITEREAQDGPCNNVDIEIPPMSLGLHDNRIVPCVKSKTQTTRHIPYLGRNLVVAGADVRLYHLAHPVVEPEQPLTGPWDRTASEGRRGRRRGYRGIGGRHRGRRCRRLWFFRRRWRHRGVGWRHRGIGRGYRRIGRRDWGVGGRHRSVCRRRFSGLCATGSPPRAERLAGRGADTGRSAGETCA